MTVWKTVRGYDELYMISNEGKLYSLLQEKILKLELMPNGYLHTSLFRNAQRKGVYIHRLVASAFIPNPENKPQVNHKNGIKHDNVDTNLEWITHIDNIHHGVEILGHRYGDYNGATKLTEDKVLNIRNDTRSNTIIAKEYNVSRSTIIGIKQHKIWKWL